MKEMTRGAVLVFAILLAVGLVPAAGQAATGEASHTIDPGQHLSPLGQQLLEAPGAAPDVARQLGDQLRAEPTSLANLLEQGAMGTHAIDPAVPTLEPGPLASELALAWAAQGEPLTTAQQAELAAETAELPTDVRRAMAWLVAGARTAETLRGEPISSMPDEALGTLMADALVEGAS